jgi:hypothetical protein
VAVLACLVVVVDAEVVEASRSAVCARRVVALVDGPSGLLALVEEFLAVLLGVEFGGGALQPPAEVGTTAVVVGQDGVDDVRLVGVLAEREGVGGFVGSGVDGVLHVGG